MKKNIIAIIVICALLAGCAAPAPAGEPEKTTVSMANAALTKNPVQTPVAEDMTYWDVVLAVLFIVGVGTGFCLLMSKGLHKLLKAKEFPEKWVKRIRWGANAWRQIGIPLLLFIGVIQLICWGIGFILFPD